MCGRFTLTKVADVADHFGLDEVPALEPRYNVAPTQAIFAVRPPGEGSFLKWGFVRPRALLLNARAETAAKMPAFRDAFLRRRCLIASDGFYEWRAVGGKKLPVHFRLRDGRLFAFAGLWEGDTCTILTTAANDLIRPLHDRMPVILDPSSYRDYLALEPVPLAAWPADDMAAVPANPLVNNSRTEGPECLSAQQSPHGPTLWA
jgi:putative SOS response-associated peptidase YedK